MQNSNPQKNPEEKIKENNNYGNEKLDDDSTENLSGDNDSDSEITGGEFEKGKAGDEEDFEDQMSK